MTILNDTPTHGYEIIAIVHKEFGVLLSPGTLYPLIHSLEAQGLIESSLMGGGKIVYLVSPKGKQKFNSALNSFSHTVNMISNFIKRQNKEVGLTV